MRTIKKDDSGNIIYAYKNHFIVPAGSKPRERNSLGGIRNEIKTFYKILDCENNEIKLDRDIFSISEAERIISGIT